ncbi:MAG: nitrate reductase cytochrome c-type subunit, partial [Planctomycetota bacterium]
MKWSIFTILIFAGLVAACSNEDASSGKTNFAVRAARRSYDGAPPVIPHGPVGTDCTKCHTLSGEEVPILGFAPANPHVVTKGMSVWSRCTQCHVFKEDDSTFRKSNFVGKAQAYHGGSRQ